MRLNQLLEYIEVGDKSNYFVYYKGLIIYCEDESDNIDVSEYPALKDKLEDNGYDDVTEIDVYELQGTIDDQTIVGMYFMKISNNTLIIYGDVDKQDTENSITNRTLKKIAKYLNVDKIQFHRSSPINDGDEHVDTHFLSLGIEQWYHGTSITNFLSMLKTGGIKPYQDTNFAASDNRFVFLSTSVSKAIYYTQASGGYPCIVVVEEIPDPSKAVIDYDKGRDSRNTEHEDEFQRVYSQNGSKDRLSAEKILDTGVIGYQGRIPKSKFSYFMCPEVSLDMEWAIDEGTSSEHQFEYDEFHRYQTLEDFKKKSISILYNQIEMEIDNSSPSDEIYGLDEEILERYHEGEYDLSDYIDNKAEELFFNIIHSWGK